MCAVLVCWQTLCSQALCVMAQDERSCEGINEAGVSQRSGGLAANKLTLPARLTDCSTSSLSVSLPLPGCRGAGEGVHEPHDQLQAHHAGSHRHREARTYGPLLPTPQAPS